MDARRPADVLIRPPLHSGTDNGTLRTLAALPLMFTEAHQRPTRQLASHVSHWQIKQGLIWSGSSPSSLFCTLLESLRSPFGSLALPWGVLHSNYSWVMTANTSVGCKRQEACKEAVTGGGVSVLGWNYNSRESGPPTKPSFVYSAVHFSTLTIPNSTQLCCTPYYCTF